VIAVLRLLHLRHVRRQPLRSSIAVVALAAGVSLAVGIFIAAQSVTTSLAHFGRQLGGPAPLRVVGADSHGGLDEGLTAKVAAVPGVAQAVPAIQTVTIAERPDGSQLRVLAMGIDCSIQGLIGNIGCSERAMARATATSAPTVSSSLLAAVGRQGTVRTDAGRLSLAQSPTLDRLDAVNRGQVVVLPIHQAQQVFGRPGQVDTIYVRLAQGANAGAVKAAVARAVGPWNAVLRSDEPRPGTFTAMFILPLLGMLGGVAMAVAALLVFNIMTLSLEERRRQLAIASAVGATRRVIVRGAMGEAGVLGVVGGLVGGLLGAGVAYPMVRLMSGQSERSIGAVLTVHVTPAAVVMGVFLGAVVAVAAAVVPARRATRLDIVAELGQGSSRAGGPAPMAVRATVALGGVTAVGLVLSWVAQRGGGIEVWQPIAAQTGVTATSVGVFAGILTGAPLVVAAVARLARRSRLPGLTRLGLSQMARQPRRAGTVAAAIGAAVGLGAGLANFLPANRAAMHDAYGHLADGRVYVAPPLDVTNSAGIDAKLSPTQLDRLRAVPGVASVGRTFFLVTGAGSRLTFVSAYEDVAQPFSSIQGDAPPDVLARGDVMVGPELARRKHLRAGSSIELATPTGFRTLRVGGVWAIPVNRGSMATVSPAVFERLWGPQPPADVFARPAPGVSVETLAARIRSARLDPVLNVLTPAQYTDKVASEIAAFLEPFWALQRALLFVAFVAVLATLLLVGIQRRREQAMMAAVGLSPRRLARVTVTEAAVLGTVGGALGIVAGIGLTVSLSEVAGVLFGLKPPIRIDVLPALLYLAVGVVVAFAGAALPAWRNQQVQVVDALRYE